MNFNLNLVKIKRFQLMYTFLLVFITTVGVIISFFWILKFSVTLFDLCLFMLMWFLTSGFGISIWYHRFFTHRSFNSSKVLKFMMGISGSMSFQGPVIYWVSVHRKHHEFSDNNGDPHSPISPNAGVKETIKAFWHSHIGWMAGHEIPNPIHYAPDLLKDPIIMWINRRYLFFALLGQFLPAVLGGLHSGTFIGFFSGFLWGGIIRLFVCSHLTWSINSFCHIFGKRDHITQDNSRNVMFLAIPTFGESWHNGHHAYPYSAKFGQKWWQFDLGYILIWVLSIFKLTSDIKTAKDCVWN